jgi:uncharacterized protein
MLFSSSEIYETVRMIESEHLDIRTITMGISLRDCAAEDGRRAAQRIYEKIVRKAGRLVSVGSAIAEEFGVPIIHKRIAVTPIALVAEASEEGSRCGALMLIAQALERAAKETGVNFIGGFSALVEKGATPGDMCLIRAIPEALSTTERVCGSVNLGTTKTGINMDVVAEMGRIIKETAAATADRDGIGCAKLVVFCNAPGDNPFMAGAYHGPGEPDCQINVGISGPGAVKVALERVRGERIDTAAETIKRTAFKITRLGQLVAAEASHRLGVPFGIVDLSLAPTPEVGDSVASILEELGVESAGAPGTTAALALLNDAVKKGGIMASSHVGGLSGAFIPVSEDAGMIAAVERGSLSIEKLEALTCVCSVGLDMIAVPGDTSAATISGIIADEAAIGMINQKTTAVRIIPVPGKGVGDRVVFGGLLGEAPVMRVNGFSCEALISRGGRLPAPVHSFRN